MSATACSVRFSGALKGAAPPAAQRDQLADHASARAHRRDQLVRELEARDVRAELGRRPGASGVVVERAQQRGAGLVAVGDGDRLERAVAVGEQADQAGVADQLGDFGGGQARKAFGGRGVGRDQLQQPGEERAEFRLRREAPGASGFRGQVRQR